MRQIILAGVALAAFASVVRADDRFPCWGTWLNGVLWGQAFPERETFGAFAPRYAASVAGGPINNPEELIQRWHRLPNELHQQDCGTDSVGQPKRCLQETFQGSGEYRGASVTARFDTIGGSWHFVGFDVQ
jgi:hypothetical protein